MRRALIVPLAIGLLSAQTTQKTGQTKQEPANSKQAPAAKPAAASKDEPKPLFGGTLDVRSSSDRKESATLGFKGIDPSGKLDQQVLGTAVTAADQAKLKTLAAAKPTPAQLTAFLKEGKLQEKAK